MGITVIGTRTTGSFGVTKSDKPGAPPYDETHEVDAAEHNRMADALIVAQTVIGLDDGSTNGSLEQGRLYALHLVTAGYTAAVGDIVRVSSDGSGLAVVTKALATQTYVQDSPLYRVFGAAPGGSLVSGAILVMRYGLVSGVAVAGSPAIGSKVYLTDTGTFSTAVGTFARLVGKIVAGAGPWDVWFDGLMQGATPQTLQAAYDGGATVVEGNSPGSLTLDGTAITPFPIPLVLKGVATLLDCSGLNDTWFIAGQDTVSDTQDATGISLSGGDGSATRPPGGIQLDTGANNGGGTGTIAIGANSPTDALIYIGKGDTSGVTTIVQGDFRLTGVFTPGNYGSDQNDITGGGVQHDSILRLACTVQINITGITGGADGRVIHVVNVGSFPFILKSQNAGSSAANRFAIAGNDIAVPAGRTVSLIYDGVLTRWRALSLPATISQTGTPAAIAGTGSAGTVAGGLTAPFDHVHAHGAQTDGTMHAVADSSKAGFLAQLGAAGKIPVSDGTNHAWSYRPGRTVTGAGTLAAADNGTLIEWDLNGANRAMALPAVNPGAGWRVRLKKKDTGTNTATITQGGSESIEYVAGTYTWVLSPSTDHPWIDIVSTGTDYVVC